MCFTLKDYNALQLHQKAIVVCSYSTLLDVVVDEKMIYTLYAYSGYYIEVRVNNITKQLIGIVAFSYGEDLNKYLDKIELEIN